MKKFPIYLPLLTLAFLGYCLRLTHGHYLPKYLVWLVVAVGLTVAQLARGGGRRPGVYWLLALCLYQGWQLSQSPGLFEPQVEWARLAIHLLCLGHFFCLLLTAGLLWKADPKRAAAPLWGSGLLLLAARVLVLWATPQPFIDVFVVGTEGADRFLQGQDPFTSEYADIYGGTYEYRPGYIYWPTVLFLQTASRWLFGDIRVAFILGELLAVVLIAYLTRGRGPLESRLWAVAWWTFPVALTMLEKAWVDTFLLTFMATLLWAHRRESTVGAGISLGLMAACKQYALVIPPLYWILLARCRGWGEGLKSLVVTGLTWTALMAPFAISGGWGFYEATFRSILILPMRPDALTLQSYFLNQLNWPFPQKLVLLLYLLAFLGLGVWVYFRPRLDSFRVSLFVLFSLIFIAGKQAFLNYYYLLAFLLLLTCAQVGDEPLGEASGSEERQV